MNPASWSTNARTGHLMQVTLALANAVRGDPTGEDAALLLGPTDVLNSVSLDTSAPEVQDALARLVPLYRPTPDEATSLLAHALPYRVLGRDPRDDWTELQRAYVRHVAACAPLGTQINRAVYCGISEMRTILIELASAGYAASHPTVTDGIFTDTYAFGRMYESMLNHSKGVFPRRFTRIFAEHAARHNLDLAGHVLAHAFPDYAEPTEAILNLGTSSSAAVYDSPNFAAHYEHLIMAPFKDKVGLPSAEVMGRMQDMDLLWYFIYKRIGDARAERREAREEGKKLFHNPMWWLYQLACHFTPDSAFARSDLLERAMLYRQSTSYLQRLIQRSAEFGQVTDSVLQLTDSKNVLDSLVEVYKNLQPVHRMRLAETAPGLSAILASVSVIGTH